MPQSSSGRVVLWSVALLTTAVVACHDPTAPGECFQVTTPFSQTAADFIARVAKITYESGASPAGGYISQYAVWLTVSPNTTPNAGILLSRSTPLFIRGQDGRVRSTTVCALTVGDLVEVSHDNRWALGSVEAPPGDTLYFPTQVAIRR